MTRAQVHELLPLLTPSQRQCVGALLDGPMTTGDFVAAYCPSFSQQCGKARRKFGIPIVSEPLGGDSAQYRYYLDLEDERHAI